MPRKKKTNISKEQDPIFYYKTKIYYQENEIPNKYSKSPETEKAVKSCLSSYHKFLVEKENRDLETISFQDYSLSKLKSFRVYLLNELHYKSSTVNQRTSLIRKFLQYGAECDEAIMPIYLEAKKLNKLPVPDRPILYFSEKQIENMINAPDRSTKIGRRNCAILTIEYDAALRINEVTQLLFKDIRINEADPKIMVRGKGNTYLPVPLTDKAVMFLKEYIKEFHKDSLPDAPFFYGIYGDSKRTISVDTIEHIICCSIQACRDNGIEFPVECHSHMIRKSRAMHLYERGVPLTHIQQILRHKSMSTTRGFYAFATLKTLRKSLEAADKEREEGKEKKWMDPEIRKKLARESE